MERVAVFGGPSLRRNLQESTGAGLAFDFFPPLANGRSLDGVGRTWFGARLLGGPQPAGQDHPAEEAAGHEQERQKQASNHETSIVRAGVTALGRMTVRTPSRRSAAMPS